MLSTTSKAYKGTLTNDLHSKWLQVTRIVVANREHTRKTISINEQKHKKMKKKKEWGGEV